MYVSAPCLVNSNLKTNSCLQCQKRKFELIGDLYREELEVFDRHRKHISFKKGETIFRENSKPAGLYCLSSGSVKLSRMGTEGIERITGLKAPVDFFGHEALVSRQTHNSTATALTDCRVCIIETDDFFNALKSNSGFSLKIIQSFANGIMDTEKRIVNLSQKHMKARLAEALMILIDIFGFAQDGKTIDLKMKRSDLAALSYMTTSNTIRFLSMLADENYVRVKGRSIVVLDRQGLEKISDLNF